MHAGSPPSRTQRATSRDGVQSASRSASVVGRPARRSDAVARRGAGRRRPPRARARARLVDPHPAVRAEQLHLERRVARRVERRQPAPAPPGSVELGVEASGRRRPRPAGPSRAPRPARPPSIRSRSSQCVPLCAQALHVDAVDVLQLADRAAGEAVAQRPERRREAARVVDGEHDAALAGQRRRARARPPASSASGFSASTARDAGRAQRERDQRGVRRVGRADADELGRLGAEQRRRRRRGPPRRPERRAASAPARGSASHTATSSVLRARGVGAGVGRRRRRRDAARRAPAPIAPQPITAARSTVSAPASARCRRLSAAQLGPRVEQREDLVQPERRVARVELAEDRADQREVLRRVDRQPQVGRLRPVGA